VLGVPRVESEYSPQILSSPPVTATAEAHHG
jgi:hypothetical protein